MTGSAYGGVVLGGGGGGGVVDPVADLFGDPDTAYEFDTDDLSDFTALNSPDVYDADTTIPGCLFLKHTASGFAVRGVYVASPATPFTAITRIVSTVRLDNQYSGMFVGAASPGGLTNIGPHQTSGVRYLSNIKYDSDPTGSPSSGGGIMACDVLQPIYLAIVVNSSSDIDTYGSFDGLLWIKLQDALDPSLTIGSVGLMVDSGAGSPNAASFEFLRLWESALTFSGV